MGKKMMSFGRFLDSFCLSNGGASSCLCCINNFGIQDDIEFEPLVDQSKDASDKPQTLAFFLKPKMVVLRVSMHCNGCSRKVQRHLSKMEVTGVTSYQVDLETKMVIVMGDIVPFEVLESVSKVKNAQLWTAPISITSSS
ncbi:protein SODIUM POTASSIUM ROOT DEFECTIVE 2 isoform X1 [Rutidosis leptorrhynchoides]|uniref:protein SODIUM POTASSIUM ROOT DEFECTIVE 2 isoform X1 n=1 Tax=Rutidosis leptorrhynchoides TaxID=125765 RepID=UPI003A99AC99